MISIYFGLPGSGKTTLLAARALGYVKRGVRVYTNVPLAIEGVVPIDPRWLGLYDISDGVVLLDEMALYANSRDYKSMSASMRNWIALHRHYGTNVEIYTQRYNGVDINIRALTSAVYHVSRLGPLSVVTPLRYAQVPPAPGMPPGDIVEGYAQYPLLARICKSRLCLRPRYYRYFDSYSRPYLPSIPDDAAPELI